MTNIQVKVRGAEQVVKSIDKIWDDSMKELAIGMQEVLQRVYNSAYSNIHHQTGKLGQSMLIELRRRRVWIEGKISANTKYAAYVELGTSKISPRRYMWGAITSNETFIVERLGRSIESAIETARYQKAGVKTAGRL